MIQHAQQRLTLSTSRRDKALLTLILISSILISQWAQEFNLICLEFFQIYLYYDERRAKREDVLLDIQSIKDTLNKTHSMFNDEEQNSRIIVIFNYVTWAKRNESKSLKTWRRNIKDLSKRDAIELETQLDHRWHENLFNCFDIIICDEAHVLKSFATKTTIVIDWLNAKFHILIIATSMSNEMNDWSEYISLIESKNAKQWWSDTSLTIMSVDKNVNSFDLTNDHLVVKLKLTQKTTKKFLFRYSISSVIKNLYLRKIWEIVLLKRTNSFRISFDENRRIEDVISFVQTIIINCAHKSKETKKHTKLQNMLTEDLIVVDFDFDIKDKKSKWFLKIHRQLQLLFMFLNLSLLDETFNLKIENMKIIFEDLECHMSWLKTLISSKIFIENLSQNLTSMLKKLMNDVSKIRVLFKNLRDQMRHFFCERLSYRSHILLR